MVLHIIEQMRPDQTRGIAEMVAVLKEMRMTKRFHEITLQNAVVNATVGISFVSVANAKIPRRRFGPRPTSPSRFAGSTFPR